MKSKAHVIVSGYVQGVFFRSATQKEAESRDISGWVRNLPDGRVEAVFEGEKDQVEEMIEFCRKGPPNAVVRGAEVNWEEYRAEFSLEGFRIIR